MNHFTRKEFMTNGNVDDPSTLAKIDNWIKWLSPVREVVDFKCKITDGVRFGEGTSQHYYRGNGAADIRPVDRTNSEQIIALGLALMASKHITRVCYYPPSKLFPTGGFHVDRKIGGKHLFWNIPVDKVSWKQTSNSGFLALLNDHEEDLKKSIAKGWYE